MTLESIGLFLNAWGLATWEVIELSAPWLLFGFALAGIIHAVFPQKLIGSHLNRPGFWSVLKAAAIGAPMPLCSCSVIPVATSLRRAGASRGATASFMISTPEVGVDGFFLSYGLLGPVIAFTRTFTAFFTALFVGVMVDRTPADSPDPSEIKSIPGSHDCSITPDGGIETKSLQSVLKSVLSYGFVEIVDDLAKPLVWGFAVSGLLAYAVPPEYFQDSSLNSVIITLLMLVVSIPVYVCAASSTPLAAVLLAKGVDPGAVLVFLLAGPATNVTSILAVKQELGSKALFSYLAGIASFALLSAMLLTYVLLPLWPLDAMDLGITSTHEHREQVSTISALIVSALLLKSLAGSILRREKAHDCCH